MAQCHIDSRYVTLRGAGRARAALSYEAIAAAYENVFRSVLSSRT